MAKKAKLPEQDLLARQFVEIKRRYPDVLLFFRYGDSYEAYNDDAAAISEALGEPLSRQRARNRGMESVVAIRYIDAESEIAKLVAAGRKVAVCEQIGQP